MLKQVQITESYMFVWLCRTQFIHVKLLVLIDDVSVFADGEASLIFSRGNSIQRMSLPPRPNNIGIIYQRLGAIHVGVDYDCVDQRVYWTEVRKGVIARARYDGSEIEVVVQNDESGSPEGEESLTHLSLNCS